MAESVWGAGRGVAREKRGRSEGRVGPDVDGRARGNIVDHNSNREGMWMKSAAS